MTLLARIFEHPDDDHAREIVADALQEQGDPHGTLIALQMALAKLGPDDDLERDQLEEEIEAYLLEHGDAIREKLGVDDLSCKFARGFVDEVELTAKALAKNVEKIVTRSPVRHICITRGDAPALRAGFAKLAGSTVRALTLGYMYPEGLEEIFGELALSLESLDLSAGADTAENILQAKCCRALKSLRISTYQIEEAGRLFRLLPETLERL
ncbi:MAG: TIGR02996 domain-containing protein, partial [Polyangiales bacterium]